MDTKIALIGILVRDWNSTDDLNRVLHDYSQYIIGRMGIPYKPKNANVISVALDAPQDIINALAGKIGRIPGLTTKTISSEN
ncbi:MAG: iron-only hydrogenase system regulator [Ruminococcus sp.]|jgi:putative iron-only hydrogenase system regulator|nr:iron-only hydrogenase system regulator [Ruminococcus sp.]